MSNTTLKSLQGQMTLLRFLGQFDIAQAAASNSASKLGPDDVASPEQVHAAPPNYLKQVVQNSSHMFDD